MRAARESHLATLMQHHTRWTACLTNDVPARAPFRDACVIMDAAGRSRGYGFLAFHRHEDAENAVATLQGKLVGSRRVKLGWSRRDDPLPPVDSSIVDR